jgi:enamine deaminase RidA (YjgF/YER057c/UK114 family)
MTRSTRREWLYRCGFLAAGATAGLSFRARGSLSQAYAQAGSPRAEDRVRQLKLELPAPARSANTLVPAVRVGELLYVSGHGPSRPDGSAWVGRLGADLNVPQGQQAARAVGLRILGVVRAELGSLDRVVRLVKTLGMVNCTPDFTQQPQVINGFSDLMVEVFGEQAGKGARSAVGMASLPGGIPVEVEAIFQVRT